MSKVERKPLPNSSGSKLLKISETNIKAYPRQNFYKRKVWNGPRHYLKAKAHNKKKRRVTNKKGTIRQWVPKSKLVFVDMPKGKYNAPALVSGQRIPTSFNKRKSYVPIQTLKEEGKLKFGEKHKKSTMVASTTELQDNAEQ